MKKSKNGAEGTVLNTEKCDLLIVDDEESIRYLVGEIIKSRFPSLRIEYAEDGLEGFKKVKAFKPRIVWTCIRMPRMNGLELIELIRQNPDLKKTKILVWTACYTMEDVKNRALELKVDRFIPKSHETFNDALSAVTEWMKHEAD